MGWSAPDSVLCRCESYLDGDCPAKQFPGSCGAQDAGHGVPNLSSAFEDSPQHRFLAGSRSEETKTHPSQEACPEPQNLQVAGLECLSDT